MRSLILSMVLFLVVAPGCGNDEAKLESDATVDADADADETLNGA
jgi:hypothetical protein